MAKRRSTVLKERRLKLEAQVDLMKILADEIDFKNKTEEAKFDGKYMSLVTRLSEINFLIGETANITVKDAAGSADDQSADDPKDIPGS